MIKKICRICLVELNETNKKKGYRLCSSCNQGYIYGLFASDKPLIIRYVGQTRNPMQRLTSHLSKKKHKDGVNLDLEEWKEETLKNGFKIGMRILSQCSFDELDKDEQKWISICQLQSPLCNK